jgi:hypothetical protein
MLGYIIDNKMINGTPARDRFLPRLEGVANQSLIENDVRKLDAVQSKVIFLDIAKQNTDNGLAFTLFSNFLKSLGFRDDLYGFMEYELFIDGKHEFLKEKAKDLFDKDWSEIKKSNRDIARAMRRIYMTMDYSEAEYSDTLNTYKATIENYSASKFKVEIEKYIVKCPDETLVFIFDEASEALSQKKINILDLEAISEAISSISKKVWTIAIAQEKLDDVINNTNVNRSNLTKVTDRFKTKIHLDSTEVDVIIRNRLLQKKEGGYADLVSYFNSNDGLISNATNLKSNFPTKTTSADQFATYYPFHRYQFDLLQKFLFSSNKALVTTQIAARGMIITTFDVLRKGLKDHDLYRFTTAHDLCQEAQTSPPADLDNKYKNATQIIKKAGLDIHGEKLLKTIHFINESEFVSTTVENITKSYIAEIESYYDLKPYVENALNLLVESKLLLLSNNNYKITSNLEGKLLEEMNDFDVELFIKKRELVGYLKKTGIFRQVSVINEDSIAYNFNILTDLEDEIIGSSNKQLRLTAYSLFNINEDRQDFIESLKLDTHYNKEVITLVPDNSQFTKIDKLLEEVKRYAYMEEKYGSDEDANKKQIIREFAIIKDEKEKDLRNLIEAAYTDGSLIYLFDEIILNKDSFKGTVNEVERKLIKNVYTKRLSRQLSEAIGVKLINESNNTKLHKYFSGDEFKFFDANGNFTGDHLKVTEELNAHINNKYIDGRSLEESLSIAPWGYSYGTISTALAVLFRAGRLVVKFNDTEYFAHTNKAAHEVFSSSTKFKSARFKSITKALNAAQKNKVVQALLDLDFESHTGNKIDWNASDFELAEAITYLADHFITSVSSLRKTQPDFDKLFGKVANQKDVLLNYTSKTTAANYIEKSEHFLGTKTAYSEAIKTIVKAEKFIKRNIAKIKGFTIFVEGVGIELNKAGIKNDLINSNTSTFKEAIKKDVIDQFSDILNAAQNIKDEYYTLMDTSAKSMSASYLDLKEKFQGAQTDLTNNYPAPLNVLSSNKLKLLVNYCDDRILKGVRLEYQIICQDSKYSLSDILNYIVIAPTKDTELQMLIGDFVKTPPKPKDPKQPKQPKKMQLTIIKKVMTTKEYKAILASQLQGMAGMDNDDEIELTLKN